MSRSLADIIRAVHREKGKVLVDIDNGEVAGYWTFHNIPIIPVNMDCKEPGFKPEEWKGKIAVIDTEKIHLK